MASLCARSEQCEYDIRIKLMRSRLSAEAITRIIEFLKERKFLDDGRYAVAYASDKVRFSFWGKLKIRMGLRAKRISDIDIRNALESIVDQDYETALSRVIKAKVHCLDPRIREDYAKLYRALLARGFESEIAIRGIREEVNRHNNKEE